MENFSHPSIGFWICENAEGIWVRATIYMLFSQIERQYRMVERVEISRRTTVVDGKVYSVKRQSEPFFLLRLNDLSIRYLVVTADTIDFHGFERFVWPINADQISVFEKLDEASAYFQKLTKASEV
jgi:hypothetical protein